MNVRCDLAVVGLLVAAVFAAAAAGCAGPSPATRQAPEAVAPAAAPSVAALGEPAVPSAEVVELRAEVARLRARLAAAVAPAPAPAPPAPADPLLVAVERVIDGDTLALPAWDAPPWPWHVRLLGVDTPERGRRGWAEATACLRALLAGAGAAGVRIELPAPGGQQAPRDGFGRLLAYVWLADGRCANVELVRAGWSVFVTRHGEGPHAASFRAAEAEARAARRGLWAPE